VDQKTILLDILKEFEAITSSGYREAASRLSTDRPPIGFFCPYVPEELLHAAGALPFRLMGTPVPMSHVQAHLPSSCCHLVKSSLESLLQGELGFLKGIIFSHTCDSMQGLADIWAFQGITPLQFNLMIPASLDSRHSHPYLKSEMERLKDFLESHFGRITPENLKAAIHLFNRIRKNLAEIYRRRKTGLAQLSSDHFAKVLRGGYWMDRDRYLKILEDLLEVLPQRTPEGKEPVPLYLLGNMVHSPFYFSLIEEAGATVVQDDLCSGARFLRLMVPEDADPIDGLTRRYLTSFLCPSKHKAPHAPIESRLKDVQESGAKGVIFLLYKYCETFFFDYPDLKRALESKGIPSLLLEVEDPSTSTGQLKTRIQAFVEMLTSI